MSDYLKKFLFTFLILAMPYMNSILKAMNEEKYELDYLSINMNGRTYNLPIARKIEIPMDQNYEPIYPPSTISEFTPEMRQEAAKNGRANAGLRSYLKTSVAESLENTETVGMLVPQSLLNSYSAARGYKY